MRCRYAHACIGPVLCSRVDREFRRTRALVWYIPGRAYLFNNSCTSIRHESLRSSVISAVNSEAGSNSRRRLKCFSLLSPHPRFIWCLYLLIVEFSRFVVYEAFFCFKCTVQIKNNPVNSSSQSDWRPCDSPAKDERVLISKPLCMSWHQWWSVLVYIFYLAQN